MALARKDYCFWDTLRRPVERTRFPRADLQVNVLGILETHRDFADVIRLMPVAVPRRSLEPAFPFCERETPAAITRFARFPFSGRCLKTEGSCFLSRLITSWKAVDLLENNLLGEYFMRHQNISTYPWI